MQERKAVRRLVKSPPELWAQCSDPASLARHLSGFGEIRITRLEPESTVAWEGESVSGTVTLEASGWGTRVQFTAAGPQAGAAGPHAEAAGPQAEAAGPQAEACGDAEAVSSTPVVSSLPGPRDLTAWVSSLFRRRRQVPTVPPAPLAVSNVTDPVVATAPDLPVSDAPDLVGELEAALDSLGQAHHRPYSRS